jgi:hypothetical protein
MTKDAQQRDAEDSQSDRHDSALNTAAATQHSKRSQLPAHHQNTLSPATLTGWVISAEPALAFWLSSKEMASPAVAAAAAAAGRSLAPSSNHSHSVFPTGCLLAAFTPLAFQW